MTEPEPPNRYFSDKSTLLESFPNSTSQKTNKKQKKKPQKKNTEEKITVLVPVEGCAQPAQSSQESDVPTAAATQRHSVKATQP